MVVNFWRSVAAYCGVLFCIVWLTACAESGQVLDDEDAAAAIGAEPVSYEYVGSQVCRQCHQAEFDAWSDSHHFHAMQPVSAELAKARDGKVLADGYALTQEDNHLLVHQPEEVGESEDRDTLTRAAGWPVAYVFGHTPLQQYLLDMGSGRLQAFDQPWDTQARAHYKLYPEVTDSSSVLHWSKPGQTWNYMCADCHSTDLRKNYDAATDQYHTTYAEVSVGCEACHGGGSAHVLWANNFTGANSAEPDNLHIVRGQPAQNQMNTCAQCHSRRAQLAEGFNPRQQFLDHYVPSLLTADLYHADGQIMDEVYVYGSFLQSKMFQAGVACSNCHDPHSGGLKLAGNQVCTQCHNPAGRAEFPSLRRADYDNTSHHKHQPASAGGQCVNCHMRTETYMGVDDRRDHSFRIPSPHQTVEFGVPNACADCHAEQGLSWQAAAFEEMFGVQSAVGADTYFTRWIAGGRAGRAEAEAPLAALALDKDVPGIVRGTAVSLLGGYNRHVSATAVTQGLRDSDALVRLGAIQATGRWPAQERWQRLRPLLEDELLAVRTAVVQALLEVLPTLDSSATDALQPLLAEYRETLALVADRAEGLTNLAGLELATGNLAAAEGALQRANRLNPQWIPAYVNLADLYRQTGRDVEAGPLLDAALAVDENLPNVLLAKALWLVRQQQRTAALPLLKKAYELAPDTDQYLYVYAVALHSAQQSQAALKLLEARLQSDAAGQQIANLAMSIARDSGDMAAVTRLLAPDS